MVLVTRDFNVRSSSWWSNDIRGDATESIPLTMDYIRS